MRHHAYLSIDGALLRSVGSGPALVFGSNAGGVVGLDLAARYPDQVVGSRTNRMVVLGATIRCECRLPILHVACMRPVSARVPA